MAVGTEIASAGPFTADGENRTFEYDFPSTSADEVSVYCNGLEVTGTMADITFGPNGGAVTFNYTPNSGDVVIILRNMPFKQQTVIENNTAFLPKVIETALDRLTMMCQQLKEICERAVVWPPGSKYEATASLEALLAAAVQSATDVTMAVESFSKEAAEFEAKVETSNAELDEKTETANTLLDAKQSQLESTIDDLMADLAAVSIMGADTSVNLGSLVWGDGGEDYHNSYESLTQRIASLPRNLGGHTLTLIFGTWLVDEINPLVISGFYNGALVIDAPTFYDSGNAGVTAPAFILENCLCPVKVRNLAAPDFSSENNTFAEVSCCSLVQFSNTDVVTHLVVSDNAEAADRFAAGISVEGSHILFASAGDNNIEVDAVTPDDGVPVFKVRIVNEASIKIN